jgi:hypothetical protein
MRAMAKTNTNGSQVTVVLPAEYNALLDQYVASRRRTDPMAKRSASARELLVDALRRWSEVSGESAPTRKK